MDFLDLIDKYRDEMSPEQMLGVAEAIGHFVSEKLGEEDEKRLCAMVYGVIGEGHFDKYFSDEAIEKMWYEDETGKHKAPFFSDDEIRTAFERCKDDISDYTIYDLSVTMNMLRSDYHKTLDEYAKTWDEKRDMVINMAISYLQDSCTAYPTTKIWHTING